MLLHSFLIFFWQASQLPGAEALDVPGKKEGEIKMVREGGSAWAYSWSSTEGKWSKVGQVWFRLVNLVLFLNNGLALFFGCCSRVVCRPFLMHSGVDRG